MNHKLLTLLLSSLLFAACGDKTPATTTGGGGDTTGGTDGDDGHGAEHPLGELKVGSFQLTITQEGEIAAGKEAAFDIEFPKDTTMPGTLRGWVGVESAKGSRKGPFDKVMGKMHGHVDVPDPIPAGSKLWLEIDLDSGAIRGSIALHQ